MNRSAGGSTVNGKWVENPKTTLTVFMSLQDLSGRDTIRLPEGFRDKEMILVLADQELIVADQTAQVVGDRFDHHGRTWEIKLKGEADMQEVSPMNHWRGYAQLVEADDA